VYFDASALVKLYLPEPGSDELNEVVAGRSDLLVSDLAATEIASSLSRHRREGVLNAEAIVRLRRALLAHVDAGFYRRVELIPAIHREAERLLFSLDAVPLRAADALHLALAISAEAATLLTYDRRLAEAALTVGLTAPG